MKKVLFLWRGGLKNFETFGNQDYTIYDPRTKRFLCGTVSPDDEVIIVDDEIASGVTVYRVVSDLGLKHYKIAARDEIGGMVDIPLPKPDLRAPMIVVSGLAGSGKSFLAHCLARSLSATLIKWGKFAAPYAGTYGEKLFEIEKGDPLFLAREVYSYIKANNLQDRVLVIDGAKTQEQIVFLGYALRKPTIPIYVEIDEPIRKKLVELRADTDDQYAMLRDQLFLPGFEILKQKSLVVRLDSNDHSLVIDLLRRHGLLPQRGFYPNTLFYKPSIMEFLGLHTFSDRTLPEDPSQEVPEHYWKHYEERYAGNISDERKKKILTTIAVAFRLIDDILDEHTTRNGHPVFHIQTSIFNAIYVAVRLILYAKYLMTSEELKMFFKYTKPVYDAVNLELQLEIENRMPTKEEYLKTLEREAGFRAFLYYLMGKDPQEGWNKGIQAQIKDDLLGGEKHGRENTEERLNRPAAYAKMLLGGERDG